MTRAVLVAVALSLLFLGMRGRAAAIAEFCPADISVKAVGVRPTEPAALYGFELTAPGTRTVKTTVALDTSAGWFTLDVPSAALRAKELHYKGPSADFIRRVWVSDVMYVQFAKPLVVTHYWVAAAKSTGDTMGWAVQGNVACPPYAAGNPAIKFPSANPAYAFVTKDEDRLDISPGPNSRILSAVASAPLQKNNCADPFEDATITKPATPDYPDSMRPSGLSATTSVEVAINPDGTVADAWVWGPSGYQAFDDASLAAARSTTYKAGRAYCQAAPGFYFFKVSFDPNG